MNVQKDLGNQMNNDIENMKLFVKTPKHYHKWGGLILMNLNTVGWNHYWKKQQYWQCKQ